MSQNNEQPPPNHALVPLPVISQVMKFFQTEPMPWEKSNPYVQALAACRTTYVPPSEAQPPGELQGTDE